MSVCACFIVALLWVLWRLLLLLIKLSYIASIGLLYVTRLRRVSQKLGSGLWVRPSLKPNTVSPGEGPYEEDLTTPT